MLLDPAVLQDPYHFYATLQKQAPGWVVPGTDVVAISSFELLSEAVARRMRTLDDECPRRAGFLGRFHDAETRSTRGLGGNSTGPAARGGGKILWATELPSRGPRLCFAQV